MNQKGNITIKFLIAGVVILVFGAGYWLAAPFFIDKKVGETLEPIMSGPAKPEVVRQGTFVGADSFHKAKGTAKILKIGDRHYVRFEDDFEVTNGPDLFVHFGKDGQYAADARISALKGNLGSQNYEIPSGINPADYNEVWIWCRAFSVPFGKVELR